MMLPANRGAALKSEPFLGPLSRAARGAGSASLTTLLVAFAANLLVAVAKSVAAVVTGSASMLAEATMRADEMHLWIGNCLFVVAAAIAAEDPRRAAVLLGAAEVELQGARLDTAEAAVYENATTAVRAALGATALEQSLEEGRVLGRDAAVELGLGSGARASVESTSLGGTVRLS